VIYQYYQKRDLNSLHALTRKEPIPWIKENIEAHMMSPIGHIILFKEYGQILGYMAHWILKNGDIQIKRFGVLESRRGEGIGRFMFNVYRHRLTKKQKLIIHVPDSWLEVHKFLRHLGYRCNGIVDQRYRFILWNVNNRIEV